MAWSADGRFLATFSKDGQIRVYDPRNSLLPIQQGKGPSGSRGGRIVWVLDDSFLAVSGFDRYAPAGVCTNGDTVRNSLFCLNSVRQTPIVTIGFQVPWL